jgi:hypothetical protein
MTSISKEGSGSFPQWLFALNDNSMLYFIFALSLKEEWNQAAAICERGVNHLV